MLENVFQCFENFFLKIKSYLLHHYCINSIWPNFFVVVTAILRMLHSNCLLISLKFVIGVDYSQSTAQIFTACTQHFSRNWPAAASDLKEMRRSLLCSKSENGSKPCLRVNMMPRDHALKASVIKRYKVFVRFSFSWILQSSVLYYVCT